MSTIAQPTDLAHPEARRDSDGSLCQLVGDEDGFVEVPFRWPVEYYEEVRRLGDEIDPW